MKKYTFSLLIILASHITFAQTQFENYLLSGIGYISIPSSMELQSGNYKILAKEYQKEQAVKFGFEVSDNRIVFQQQGLNAFNKSSFSSYARVILQTTIGNFGDYEKLNTRLSATESELKQLSSQLKSQTEINFSGTELKLISWYGVSIVNVNGRSALKISYLRQLKDNPYVAVSIYQFHNNDRMHELTMSYRQQDADQWKPLYSRILNSFTITNVR